MSNVDKRFCAEQEELLYVNFTSLPYSDSVDGAEFPSSYDTRH